LSAGFVLRTFSTRNLAPSDFGLLAMAGTAAMFLGLVKDLGVGQAIIQRPEITKGQIDSLFFLSVLSSVASALILALSAYPFHGSTRIPGFNSSPSQLLDLASLQGLPTVPTALLAKESRFKTLAIVDVV
jgi:PST family polysaccharide transporter